MRPRLDEENASIQASPKETLARFGRDFVVRDQTEIADRNGRVSIYPYRDMPVPEI